MTNCVECRLSTKNRLESPEVWSDALVLQTLVALIFCNLVMTENDSVGKYP